MGTVVVTGGFGFVGSHLVEHLVDQGEEVIVYDLAPRPPDLRCDLSAVRHVSGDVRDPMALASVITGEVDTVYHLAAVVGVDRYLDRPSDVVEVNVLGTHHVLRRAAAVGARVVVASTSEVYGRNPAPPWREDSDRVLGSTATDRWSYATSKAAAEHLTFAYVRQEQLAASIVRYFNVYGPRQRPAYVISRTVDLLVRGLPPQVYDGGGQTRCFTYVADAVAATILAGAHPAALGESFNIGSERETTVAEAVQLATRLCGVAARPAAFDTAAAFGSRYQDIPRRIPDPGKVRRLLGWRSTTPLEEGLARTIAWARRALAPVR